MKIYQYAAPAAALAFALSFGIANAQTPLSVSCSGTPGTASITWSGSASGGVAPYALLWGNGSTSTSQTTTNAAGTFTMSIQATDASSSVATSTCSATVAATSTATSTPSSIQSQINALLQQIAQLQQQIKNLIAGSIGTSTPPVMPPGQVGKGMCVSLNRDLSEGDDGNDVSQLQQLLGNSGFDVPVTGFFGPLTMHAMMHFQLQFGIASSSNGHVGPLTRGFFERHCGEGLGKGNGQGDEDGNVNDSDATTSTSTLDQIMLPANHQGNDGKGNDHGKGQGGDHGNDQGDQ